jgi:hypothetical protein
MENTTRIAELPIQGDNGSLQNVLEQTNLEQTNYNPINIHPNPYGISEKNPIMENPVHQERPAQKNVHFQEEIPEKYRNMISTQDTHSLPSRDIPMDNTVYTQDEEIQQNYIPNKKIPDYLGSYDEEERKVRAYEKEKHHKKMLDIIFEETQLAVYVAILFFLFQTSAFRKLIWNHFTFLPILNSDGNINVNGIIFKSVLFGLVFYITQKFASYLSEF